MNNPRDSKPCHLSVDATRARTAAWSALALLLAIVVPGCRSRAPRVEAAPADVACRPLQPDEEVVPSVGTGFVIQQHTRLIGTRGESLTVLRWRVVRIEGKKVMAHVQATVDGYTGRPSDPIEMVFTRSLPGKGDLEIVSVPAGSFRCRRSTVNSGDMQIESWTAKGLPAGVYVRQVIRNPKSTTTTELIRIENAAIAPPAAPEAPPPAFTRVEPDDEVVLAVGTVFVSEMKMVTSAVDSTSVTRVTVEAVDERKATLRTVVKSGEVETETTHEMPIFAQPPLEEPVEIVDVPAGRFRCRKTTSKVTGSTGTIVTDVWMARGLPACVRMSTAGPDMSMETKLIRIENAQIRKPAPPQGDTYVLLVGVDRYADENLPSLRLAEADARALSDFFATANRSPTTAERVRVLAGKDATRVSILKAIREHLAAKTVREEDAVVLYFSGYAFSDGSDAYLLGCDAQIDALPETAISAANLAGYWGQIRARRKVLITDAGRIGDLKGLKGGFPLPGADQAARKPWEGTLLLSSSGPGQVSVEATDAGQSLFAATLLAGIGGNADESRDGRVTAEELFGYVVREVSARLKGNQTPIGRSEGTPPVFLTR